MAKLTRSRRPAADARAARNTLLTAADLAAPEKARRAEGEVGASWTPTLGSAFASRRSRRQPARPRSSRVGSRAMAMAAAKAIDCLQVVGKRDRGVAAGAQAPGELKVNAAVALKITPLPGPGVEKRALLLVAGVVVRLALTPVGKAGSLSPHATVPTLGRAEPRLTLVILLRRADAGGCAPVFLAQVHTAEQRGGGLGRHEEAGGAGGRGGPAGWADSRRGGREEEEGGGRQHANTDQLRHEEADVTTKRCSPVVQPLRSPNKVPECRELTRSKQATVTLNDAVRDVSEHVAVAQHTRIRTACEEVARDAVEIIEVAKASLDHGEQMLAVARQKTPRLASIKGCKLLLQQPPCLRLVIVRVRDGIDLDTVLVAAHWHAHEQRLRARRERAIRSARGHSPSRFDLSQAVSHSERT
eukprot:scaffold9564_cov85-Phaeocystis_antarctica.AAC.5